MSTIAQRQVKDKTATTRLNLRVAPTVKALLRTAAKLRQESLTGFILHSSQVAAETVLSEQTRFVLPEAVSGGMKVEENKRFEIPFSSGAFASTTSR